MYRKIFGPVPSRRLGRSLGINNIPSKYCSYSCIYCQVGRTKNLTIKRRKFYDVSSILNELIPVLNRLGEKSIDYITFVPDGEPTLDINLGKIAREIREITDIPLAILTNSSLLFMEDVRNDLTYFNLVSLKIDSVIDKIWRRINRPYGKLDINKILEGIIEFRDIYNGKIITETMIIKNINDSIENFKSNIDFISSIDVDKAYISIPIRPPAEKWVLPSTKDKIVEAHEIYREKLGDRVELLIKPEGEKFLSSTGEIVEDFLATISVHPMREDYAYKFIEKSGEIPSKILKKLLEEKKILRIKYRGKYFYIKS